MSIFAGFMFLGTRTFDGLCSWDEFFRLGAAGAWVIVLQFKADVGKGDGLPLLLEEQQPAVQQVAGFRVDPDVALALLIVVVGRGIGVFVPLIDPAGGNTVAEHFRHVFLGHLAAAHEHLAVLPDAVVDPVLKMVAVAALVVEPGQAEACLPPLLVVGGAIALVVSGAPPELHWRVFGQIVGQTLPNQPQLHTVVTHQCAVAPDGIPMFLDVHKNASPEYDDDLIYYNTVSSYAQHKNITP